VSKRKVLFTLNLAGGERINGYIFLGLWSAFCYRKEPISDLLNDRPAFFPFERESLLGIRIVMTKTFTGIDSEF